jgi:hypothetical protein
MAQIKEALTRDEHVVHLADALQAARSDAVDLLTQMARGASTATLTPPTPVPPVVHPAPPTKRAAATHTHRGRGVDEALELLDSIEQALASNPKLALDIDWRLYPKDGTVP